MSYKYVSTHTEPSKVSPGASIFVKKISEGRRNAVKAKISGLIDNLVKQEAAVSALREDLGFHGEMDRDASIEHYNALAGEDRARLDAIAELYQEAQRALDRAYYDFGFVKLEGYELDGNEKPTSEDIFADADPAFYAEIVAVVKAQFLLTQEQRDSFASLSTSGAAEDGKAISTTASNAGNPAVTESETASSTIQSS